MEIETALDIPRRERRIAWAAGVAIAVVGAALALFGIRAGASVAAQFSQQIGFALLTAGFIDLLLVSALDRIRAHMTRRERAILDSYNALEANFNDFQATMLQLQDTWKKGAEDINRIQSRYEVKQALNLLEYQVEEIRCAVDEEYRDKRTRWVVENADRIVKESDERYERLLAEAPWLGKKAQASDSAREEGDS